MNKFFGHLKTVLTHKWYVFLECAKLGIFWQGVFHDMSKFSPTEFLTSVKYWDGIRSPIDNEKDAVGKSMAWLHHKGRNKTHFEYWIDYIHGVPVAQEIPIKYLKEMFADWIGASRAYAPKYFNCAAPYLRYKRMGHELVLHPASRMVFEVMLMRYAELGCSKQFYTIMKNL